MKTSVIVAFLFCLNSSIANAQAFRSDKPVLCDETEKVLKSLSENYNEAPVWTAKDARNDSVYTLFVNSKTNTWTLLQMTPTVSCVLGVGENSKFLFDSI